MFLFLIACLESNLALFNLLLLCHRRRTILMRGIAFCRTSYRRLNTRLARARSTYVQKCMQLQILQISQNFFHRRRYRRFRRYCKYRKPVSQKLQMSNLHDWRSSDWKKPHCKYRRYRRYCKYRRCPRYSNPHCKYRSYRRYWKPHWKYRRLGNPIANIANIADIADIESFSTTALMASLADFW